MLEKSRVIQQCSVPPNSDFLSPEPTPNEINKCPSTSNIQNLFNYENANSQPKNYTLSKSMSGGNIQNNGTAKNGSSSSASVSSPSNNSQKEEDEKQCIFCNQPESSILAVSNSMNSHYWRSCPMLVRCKECSQVVEVATLMEHLLTECERRDSYTQCSQCSEAVKIEEIKHHVSSCRGAVEGSNRCPLCHENLEDEKLCWKKHLMGDKPCLKNTRIKMQAQKQVTIQV